MNKIIYSDDPMVPYKNTKIPPIQSKAEIDGILARWGVKNVAWRWDIENNDVFVLFEIQEEIENNIGIYPVKVRAPVIVDKETKNHPERINWTISMRVMFWYIKTHLEAAYLTGEYKVNVFMKDVTLQLKDGTQKRLAEVLKINNLDRLALVEG